MAVETAISPPAYTRALSLLSPLLSLTGLVFNLFDPHNKRSALFVLPTGAGLR